MQVLTWVVSGEPPAWGKGCQRGLEMGPLSSPVMTSYSLSIVNIDLSLTVFGGTAAATLPPSGLATLPSVGAVP